MTLVTRQERSWLRPVWSHYQCKLRAKFGLSRGRHDLGVLNGEQRAWLPDAWLRLMRKRERQLMSYTLNWKGKKREGRKKENLPRATVALITQKWHYRVCVCVCVMYRVLTKSWNLSAFNELNLCFKCYHASQVLLFTILENLFSSTFTFLFVIINCFIIKLKKGLTIFFLKFCIYLIIWYKIWWRIEQDAAQF